MLKDWVALKVLGINVIVNFAEAAFRVAKAGNVFEMYAQRSVRVTVTDFSVY